MRDDVPLMFRAQAQAQAQAHAQADSDARADGGAAAAANIRRAEVSLNSNTFPADVSNRARAALDSARRALRRGDQATALPASALAVRLLADALR